MSSWQVFGLAGCLLARLPSFKLSQCQSGFRSCLPLRGSSGFPPDSHIHRAPERKEPRSESHYIQGLGKAQVLYVGRCVEIAYTKTEDEKLWFWSLLASGSEFNFHSIAFA
jgi:hypothetical protein